jgi:cell division initiation protein
MKVNPMDIQRQVFSKQWRGFDRDEVRTYLNLVAEEVAAIQRERDHLEQEVQSLRATLDDHRQREVILKNTLLTAQRVSEEIRENARKQSEATIKEGELQADRLIDRALSRAREIELGMLDLRAEHRAARAEIRAMVSRITNLLDLQEEAEADDKVRVLKR